MIQSQTFSIGRNLLVIVLKIEDKSVTFEIAVVLVMTNETFFLLFSKTVKISGTMLVMFSSYFFSFDLRLSLVELHTLLIFYFD